MQERYRGCLLGLALGDAIGAKREGDIAARTVWWMLGLGAPKVLRWTDDTQMSLVLARHLVAHGEIEQDALADAWAQEARWSRGYGRGALRTLRMIRKGTHWQQAARSVFPDGSYGNGAAMRAAPLGLFFPDADARKDAAEKSAAITHAHPLGIEGAIVMAEAAHLAQAGEVTVERLSRLCREEAFLTRFEQVDARLAEEADPRRIAQLLGNSIRAHESVVTAVYVYLRFRASTFGDLMAFILRLRGDTDTIAAMAGALYGIERGSAALPPLQLAILEAADDLRSAADALADRAGPEG